VGWPCEQWQGVLKLVVVLLYASWAASKPLCYNIVPWMPSACHRMQSCSPIRPSICLDDAPIHIAAPHACRCTSSA
jgi:hypothetical protein